MEKEVGLSSLPDVGGTTGSMSCSMLLSQTVKMILFQDQLKKELDCGQFWKCHSLFVVTFRMSQFWSFFIYELKMWKKRWKTLKSCQALWKRREIILGWLHNIKKKCCHQLEISTIPKAFCAAEKKKDELESLGNAPELEDSVCLSKSSLKAAGELLPVHWKQMPV